MHWISHSLIISSPTNLEHFRDLETSMSSFLGLEQPMGLVQEEWGPADVPSAVWSFRKAMANRRSRRYQHIMQIRAAVPLLSACTRDRQWEANTPRNEGAWCNSARLSRGNAFSFSKYIHAQCLYWLHGQWQCSTITTKIIIHNLFQIHRKYLYFFFRRMGFGTRNRTTDSPLNSTALLMHPPHCYKTLCNLLLCTAKFTKR